MAFQRKSMESIVSKMVSWTQGVSGQLTDFRVGSKVRTLYESVAVIIEEQYDKVFRALKQLIEENIYAMLGFDKIPSTYATGIATFSKDTPADQNYYVAMGTTLMSNATQYTPPLKFYTTQDAVLTVGQTSVDVPVVCDQPGTQGNIPVGSLVTFVQKPIGIDSVTNNNAFDTGAEEETKDQQKSRFQQFIEAQARGVLQSIEFGARQSSVVDSYGKATEVVMQARASEDLPNRKGEVDLYVWNGVGAASSDLIAAINKTLTGYYDSNNNPVYGYKPGGILVNIYTAPMLYVTIKLQAVPETWAVLDDTLKSKIQAEISRYFSSLTLGQKVIQSALEANIKNIEGIYDVKLYFSTDSGTTWTMDNVVTTSEEIAVAVSPIIYE